MDISNVTKGGKAFSYLDLDLPPNGLVVTESGAMASMSSHIDLKSKLNGNFIQALLIKFLGKESLFINHFRNTSSFTQQLILTKPTPGEITTAKIEPGSTLYIQPGAYIASTGGVKFKLRYAGIPSFLAGEGLFRIKITGSGYLWYGAYGSVVEKEVQGSYIVDSGHLLSYPKGMKLQIKLSGGIFSSFFGGEGLVLKLVGNGKIKLQTRSISGLAGWLNPRFWG